MPGAGQLEELELSAEEAERLQRAFRDERFRALFAEYAAELADPEQRRLYEEEVRAMERERGMDVRFVHPTAGYVLRTRQAGSRRCYINVCSNPHIGAPWVRARLGGQRWVLPYSLTPGREELGRSGRRRFIYDVVFHPVALRLAAQDAQFQRLLSETALEAVEGHCAVELDRANATVLRHTKYKGVPQVPIIRTPRPGAAAPPPSGDCPLPPFPLPPVAAPAPPAPAAAAPPAPSSGPTTPRWSIRHRAYIDMQDYRYCRDSAPSPVPRELVVTVELPLLRSAAQAALEIRGRQLRLDSQRPAYRLRLRLPYDVDESGGRAAFHTAQRQLQVTLPVLLRRGPARPERLEEAQPALEGPGEPAADPAPAPGGGDAEPVQPPAGAEPLPPPCAERPARPESPLSPADSPDPAGAEGGPGEMVVPGGCGSAEAALCPPFQCRQDEASLTLLLHVPGIQPRSLRGDLGVNHYSLRFSTAAAAYALFLRFPPQNELARPESSVSVTAHNAAVGLAKAPGSTGLWDKFCFGPDASAPQERLFVSEENVDGFLDTVLCPSLCSQSALQSQPLIEVLDITEDRIQIKLKPQEPACAEHRGAEGAPGSPGGDPEGGTDGDGPGGEPLPAPEAAEPPAELRGTPAAGRGAAGCSSQSCLKPEPPGAASAASGGPGGEEPDLESAGSVASGRQAGPGREGEGEGDRAGAGAEAEGSQPRPGSRAASPLLREVNGQDGSVEVTREHSTHCPVVFQNDCLYGLD